jgi:hypothetical protein
LSHHDAIIDYSRVNEFGWSQELADKKKAEEQQQLQSTEEKKLIEDRSIENKAPSSDNNDNTNDDNDNNTNESLKQRRTGNSTPSVANPNVDSTKAKSQ